MLEATGRIRPSPRAAVISTAVYGVTTAFFALSHSYPVAVGLLVIGGIANLASMSITQTVVQLLAPPADRGRVIGLYGVSANGLRAGSGFTVGLLGAAIGIRWSLGFSAAALFVGTLTAGVWILRSRAGRRASAGRAGAGLARLARPAGSGGWSAGMPPVLRAGEFHRGDDHGRRHRASRGLRRYR